MKISGLIKKGKADEAVAEAEKLLKDNPLDIQLVKLFAETTFAAKRPEAGRSTMEVVKDHIPPQDVASLAILGKLYFSIQDYKRARECLERVHRAKPSDAEVSKMLKDAEALATSGKWEEASESGDFRKALQNKAQVEQLDAANKSVKTADDAEKLIADTLAKIEKEPKNVNYYLSLVGLYLQQKKYDEALSAIDRARAVVGQDPALDLRFADVKIEQYDAKIAELRTAGDETAAANMELERDQFVFNDIAERVQRYPNDQHLRFLLGEQYWKYSDLDPSYLDEALQQFQISQRSPKDRVQSLYLMALCFQKKGMLDMAVEQLTAALEQLPSMDKQKMDVFYLLGEICEAEGKLDDASKYFKEIYRADVTYKDIADRVQRIYAAQKAQSSNSAS
jgi:tetratricopeptide (TPR) repeat protein